MKKVLSFLVAIAATCATSVFAQKPAVVTSNEPGWQHIGHITANFKSTDESIEVLGADEFTAIKLKVTEAPIHIERLQVFYESGDMEDIEVKSQINSNSESQVINLKHSDRDVSRVSFTYHTVPNERGEKADIDLYGLKTNQPQGSDAYKADKAEDDIEHAADEVKQETKEAGDEIEREADEAEREIEKDADQTESDIERAADKVGDGVSEGVNDAASAIKDKKVDGKVGPGGETAYIDDNGKYYIINNEGTKVFITRYQLKDKRDND